MTDSAMKGETSGSGRVRAESRSSVHRRRGSTKSAGPEELSSDTEPNVNIHAHDPGEQVEVVAAAGVRDDAQEVTQLKELLLVHLDMISQQQDLIMAKDRQIRALKTEKEALKCRLERMERRMSLLKQKGGSGSAPSPQGGGGRQGDLAGAGRRQQESVSPTPAHIRTLNFSSNNSTPEPQQHRPYNKRKWCHDSGSLTKRQALCTSGEPAGGGSSGSAAPSPSTGAADLGSAGHHSPRRHAASAAAFHQQLQLQSNKSVFGVRHFTRSPFNPLADTGHDSDTSGRTASPGAPGSTGRRRGGRNDDPPQRGILDAVKERLQPVASYEQDDEYFHRTDRMYYVPWEVPLSPLSRISPKKLQDEVRVPSFRIRPVQTGYSMEGTENLDDEIFAKRHQKPELEEKRRKRWDMQRLREQRLYEKLQGKKQTRIAPVQLKLGKNQDVEGPPESFIPELEDVRYIEVCDNVPVSAFGYPVPQLEECEFDLPDFDLDQRESDETRRSSSTRKKR